MPAYNAEGTLEATVRELPDTVDERILVDDHSTDETVAVARRLGLTVAVHERNLGYGGNQKTCYAKALASGADVVVMLHPDYQYSPLLVTPMAGMVAYGVYDLVLGPGFSAARPCVAACRFTSTCPIACSPRFKNLLLGAKLSEYHTGFRAFSRQLLLSLPLQRNSDDFVFDNQVIAQAILLKARIGEISCPTRYFPEASSINFRRSLVYGLGVVKTTFGCCLARCGLPYSSTFRSTSWEQPDSEVRLLGNRPRQGRSSAPESRGATRVAPVSL